MKSPIYLDNSTAAKPSLRALSAAYPFYETKWGSTSAPHAMGEEVFPQLEENVRYLYKFLGASDADHFVLTSSGAEAVNQVFLSAYLEISLKTGKNQFIAVSTDEAPSLMSIGRLEELGCVGKMIPSEKSGQLSLDAVLDAMTSRTAMISLSYANGWTGVLQPLSDVVSLAKEKGVLVHVEATHALGKMDVSLKDLGVDFLSFNGEQIYAPRGTGGLFARAEAPLAALIVGGIEQGGRRAGNINTAGLASLAEACREAEDSRDYFLTEVARLRYLLEEKLISALDDVEVLFRHEERLPHVTAIAFPGVVAEALLYEINCKKVYASIGGGISQQLGILLEHSKIAPHLAESALSFSLSRETSEADIDMAADVIVDAVKLLRKISGSLRRIP